MATLLLADHNNIKLSPATTKALTAALQIGDPVDILVVGKDCESVAKSAARLQGIRTVLIVQDPLLEHAMAETIAPIILSLKDNYNTFISAGTTTGKNILPRIAALLDVMQISDIIKVISSDTFERPIYAGNAIQTVQSMDSKRIITVRTASFTPTPEGGSAPVTKHQSNFSSSLSQFISQDISIFDRPELTAARIVISGGRALQSKENFEKYIEPLAKRLNAAIGASRAAVDAGYAPMTGR